MFGEPGDSELPAGEGGLLGKPGLTAPGDPGGEVVFGRLGRGANPGAAAAVGEGWFAIGFPGTVGRAMDPPVRNVMGGSRKAEMPGTQPVHCELRVKSWVGTDMTGEQGS